MVQRTASFLYGILCYVVFLASFLYAVGFLADAVVPKTVDGATSSGATASLVVDLLLLGVFALQHTLMARPPFKRRWTRIVPGSVERSTFVLASSLALFLIIWQWRSLSGTIWDVRAPIWRDALWAICGAGWLTVLFGTFMISHTHLFGLQQVWNHFRDLPPPKLEFQTRWLYRYVRHPLMTGFIVAFWATPHMSVGHIVFAAAATGYIVVATRLFEEKDLEQFIGEPYRRYRERVPAFLPRPGRGVRMEQLISGEGRSDGHAEV